MLYTFVKPFPSYWHKQVFCSVSPATDVRKHTTVIPSKPWVRSCITRWSHHRQRAFKNWNINLPRMLQLGLNWQTAPVLHSVSTISRNTLPADVFTVVCISPIDLWAALQIQETWSVRKRASCNCTSGIWWRGVSWAALQMQEISASRVFAETYKPSTIKTC
jgi:hypothetical protein